MPKGTKGTGFAKQQNPKLKTKQVAVPGLANSKRLGKFGGRVSNKRKI